MAKSIHHSRVMIKQRHIRVGKRMVNVPSFMVRLDSEQHIDYAETSPYGGGRPGRVKRKNGGSGKSHVVFNFFIYFFAFDNTYTTTCNDGVIYTQIDDLL